MNHSNIYNILGKLSDLTPKEEPKQVTESKTSALQQAIDKVQQKYAGFVAEGETIYTKTGLIHKGTYGTDDQGSDNDDDYDEWGNEKKATASGPKKRGRPAKAKQPERVTSKAWKHKGGRKVTEGASGILSQLNEYLVQAGGPATDVLGLNLFQDFDPEEGAAAQIPEFAESPEWQAVVKQYAPIANALAKKVTALNRPLTDAEANALDDTWYDGSDAYDSVEVRYLVNVYDEQIDKIEALLAGNLTDEEFGNGQVNEYESDPQGRYVHKGTKGYGNDPVDFDDEEDQDAPASKGGAPKKRGRPAKAKQPERVTAKAWKHKDGRKVKENINLDTFVEDAMAELDAYMLSEKAVSQSQQKFMGMVHAAQKGEKPASPEVAKVAKSMGKKDAKDFASTKHKGLPQHVKESKQLTEGCMLDEGGVTFQHILDTFKPEVRRFEQGGDLDNNLFDALYDYYFDDMPYGTKKARDGDPYEWVSERFYNDLGLDEQQVAPQQVQSVQTQGTDMHLDELAKLAGLTTESKQADVEEGNEFSGARAAAIRAGKSTFTVGGKTYQVSGDDQVEEGEQKPDFLDVDKDGDEEESMKDALKDKEVNEDSQIDECGMEPMGMSAESESGMSINTSMDTKTGSKSLTVTAQGEAAEQLAELLAMAGISRPQGTSSMGAQPEVEMEEEFANEPEEAYADTDAIIHQGGDLNREKKQYASKPKLGDNPMAEDAIKLEGRLAALYNSIKRSV